MVRGFFVVLFSALLSCGRTSGDSNDNSDEKPAEKLAEGSRELINTNRLQYITKRDLLDSGCLTPLLFGLLVTRKVNIFPFTG